MDYLQEPKKKRFTVLPRGRQIMEFMNEIILGKRPFYTKSTLHNILFNYRYTSAYLKRRTIKKPVIVINVCYKVFNSFS